MGKIRILQVIGGNEVGGAEEHVLNLCRGLDRELFEVHLVCLCNGPLHALAEQQGIAVNTIPMHNPLDLTVIPKLMRLMQTLQIDIVHTHGSRANLTARLGARWLNIAIVTTVHSSLAQDYTRSTSAWLAQALDRLTTPLAQRVITISDFLQAEVKRRGAKKVVTIYNGIDPSRFTTVAKLDKVYEDLGVDPTAPLIGVVGRLHPVKGHRCFLEAAALVSASHPQVKFLIVGSGPLKDELRQLAEELDLNGKVIFTGFYQDIKQIMAILDIFCLPSISEGMGLVLLEAMFFAKPVIATAVGGIPELVSHKENGLLVPPGDPILLAAAMSRILDDKSLAYRMGHKGQQTLENFTLTKMLQQTEALYTEIAETKNQPGH